MPSLRILTLGTGTKGEHSKFTQGLVNAPHQIRLRLFWVVAGTADGLATERLTAVRIADLRCQIGISSLTFPPLLCGGGERPLALPGHLRGHAPLAGGQAGLPQRPIPRRLARPLRSDEA